MSNDPYQAPEAELVEENSDEFVLASRWQRLGASLIDGFILIVIFFGIIFSLVFNYRGFFGDSVKNYDLAAQVGICFLFLILNGYFIYTNGQTLGKKIVGIRVVTRDGARVSGHVYIFLRLLPFWLVNYIPVIGTWVMLMNHLLIFRDEKNCLHDDVAGTRVIKV